MSDRSGHLFDGPTSTPRGVAVAAMALERLPSSLVIARVDGHRAVFAKARPTIPLLRLEGRPDGTANAIAEVCPRGSRPKGFTAKARRAAFMVDEALGVYAADGDARRLWSAVASASKEFDKVRRPFSERAQRGEPKIAVVRGGLPSLGRR